MLDFTFSYPTRVFFKKDAADLYLPGLLKEVPDKVLLTYGKGSVFKNGLYDKIKKILINAGKEVYELGGIMPNPTYAKVQEGAKIIKDNHIGFILALGGGSVIDCSKIIACQAVIDKDIWKAEFTDGFKPVKGIPVGAVLTASGTGSEMNEICVITNEEEGIKRGMRAIAPAFAILDPEITKTVPLQQVFSGAFDTLSHAMETYMGTSDEDNVSDDLSLAVMKNTITNMRRLLKNPDDMQARGNLMWDSAMAENGILKAGHKTDFQVHQLEHQVAVYTDINHGQGLAVILPAYYRHIINDGKEKLTRMAKEVFGKESAEEGIDAIEDFIKECSLPTRFSQLKSTEPITEEILRKAADTARIMPDSPRPLSRDEFYEILISRI